LLKDGVSIEKRTQIFGDDGCRPELHSRENYGHNKFGECLLLARHYYSDKIWDEMGKACSTHGGEMKNAYKNMIGNPEGKRPLGRIRCRWRIILKCGREIELQCVEIIHLHRDRSLRWTVMITVLNHEIP
jgi:hypothetical protein